MFCRKCGKQVDENDLFCWNCGAEIARRDLSPQQSQEPASGQNAAFAQEPVAAGRQYQINLCRKKSPGRRSAQRRHRYTEQQHRKRRLYTGRFRHRKQQAGQIPSRLRCTARQEIPRMSCGRNGVGSLQRKSCECISGDRRV